MCLSVQYNTNYTNNVIKVSWIRYYLEMAGHDGYGADWEEGGIDAK